MTITSTTHLISMHTKAAVYSIETGTILTGYIPRRQDRRVREWIELRREELMDNWERMVNDRPLKWITPL